VQKFLRDNNASTEERKKTLEEFRRRAADLFRKKIEKQFQGLFDDCTIISGQSVINDIAIKGENRYKEAMRRHLERIYTYAHCADVAPVTADALRNKILRNIEPGEYDLKPLSEAEGLVEQYLKRQFREVPLGDVVSYFQKAPYGWSEPATIHFCNELVRRHLREFAYNGQAVDRKLLANNILSDRSSFSIREASAIPQQEVNDFMAAWKFIFNDMTVLSGLDTMELAKQCQQKLDKLYDRMTAVLGDIAQYPFAAPLKEFMPMVNEWKEIRDNTAFFKKMVAEKEQGKELMDKWKQILQFHDDQLGKYKDYVEFVKDSHYDFSELSDNIQPKIESLQFILEDEWPIDKMQIYKKLTQEVKYNIAEKVKELKVEIEKKYKETFGTLVKFAEQAGAEGYTVNENVCTAAVAPNSILVLKKNLLETQLFYDAETQRIEKITEQMQRDSNVKSCHDDNSHGQHETKFVTKLISLKPNMAKPLKTAQDVEEYLDVLRKQLMSYIDNGESILIK
jgi:hypothetical protein